MNGLRETLSQTWLGIQGSLFPWLAEELGPLTQKQQDLVATLEQGITNMIAVISWVSLT